jgi:hypothetical protein
MATYIIIIIVIVILVILAAIITGVFLYKKHQKNNTPQLLEYDFNNDNIFQNIYKLVNGSNFENNINPNLECMKYKGCKILLRNMLMLSNRDKFGIDYNFDSMNLPLFKKGVKFIPYTENYWNDHFNIITEHYEKFNAQTTDKKQSYYFYWMNLINISQLLITFLHNGNLLDISIHKYEDAQFEDPPRTPSNNKSCYIVNPNSDKEKYFNEMVNLFKLALDCKYNNIFNLYKMLIYYDYDFCVNPKIANNHQRSFGMNAIDAENSFDALNKFMDEISNNKLDIYLLLSLYNPNESKYGMFEGTKFIVALANPFLYIHQNLRYISGFMAHDLYFHFLYTRKKTITDTNWDEFKRLINMAIKYDYYPIIFQTIHNLFHEPDNKTFPGIIPIKKPFTINLFIKNIPALYFNHFYCYYINKHTTLEMNEKLFTFLLNAKYISNEIYDGRINVVKPISHEQYINIDNFILSSIKKNTSIDQIKDIPPEQIPILVARNNYLDNWIKYNNEHWEHCKNTDAMDVEVR